MDRLRVPFLMLAFRQERGAVKDGKAFGNRNVKVQIDGVPLELCAH